MTDVIHLPHIRHRLTVYGSSTPESTAARICRVLVLEFQRQIAYRIQHRVKLGI